METGLTGFNEIEIPGALVDGGVVDKDSVRAALARPTPDRLLVIAQAFRHGLDARRDPGGLQIRSLVPRADRATSSRPRRRSGATACRPTPIGLAAPEADGLFRRAPRRARRPPRGRMSRRCAASSAYARSTSASTPAPPSSPRSRPTCTRPTRATAPARRSARPSPSARDKVIILGGGPNRIGQGIEFDYCCVHAAYASRRPASRPSWSTATRRPCRPITTPRTGSISSR